MQDWSKYRETVNMREEEDRKRYREEIEAEINKIVLNYVGEWTDKGVTTSKGELIDHDELWDLLTRYKYMSILANIPDTNGKSLTHRDSKKLGRCLELGCDWGHCFSVFEPYFEEVYGIEATEWSAKKGLKEEHNITWGVMESTPFRDNFFDVVLSRHVLEHGDDPDIVLKEIRRITKPGGYSCHTLPVCMGIEPPKDSIIHKSNLSQKQWVRKFRKHGFEIVRTFWQWNHDQEELNIIARKARNGKIFSLFGWRTWRCVCKAIPSFAISNTADGR
jgi:SAM-dependent methyltransferase